MLGLVDKSDPKHFQKVSIALGPASQPNPTECLTVDDIVVSVGSVVFIF
jgi:hypothetical protein